MQPLVVTLELVKETKGSDRFDSPDPDAAVTNVYVCKSAFGENHSGHATAARRPPIRSGQ